MIRRRFIERKSVIMASQNVVHVTSDNWKDEVVGSAAPVLVDVGGLRGVGVDIAIAAGWTQSCSFANGVPTVPLLTDGAGLRWVIAGSERLRLYVLDVPDGGTVIVDLDAFDGDLYDSLLRVGAPIVKSLEFATG